MNLKEVTMKFSITDLIQFTVSIFFIVLAFTFSFNANPF